MKKRIKQLSSLLLVTIAVSCSSGPNHLESVKLNNGELWEANVETTKGIDKMQKIIYNYDSQIKGINIVEEKIDSYHAINSELKKEFNLIIKNCSMDGEGHEQLHNYIKPMLSMFATIDGDNIELIERDYKALKVQLEAYNSFFK